MAASVLEMAIAAPTPALTPISTQPRVAAMTVPPIQTATSEIGNPAAARYCERIAVRPRKKTPGINHFSTGTVSANLGPKTILTNGSANAKTNPQPVPTSTPTTIVLRTVVFQRPPDAATSEGKSTSAIDCGRIPMTSAT